MNRSLRQRHWEARTLSRAHRELGGQQSALGAAAVPSAVLVSTSQTPTMSTSHYTSPQSSVCPQTSSLMSPWPGSPVALSALPYSPDQTLPLALVLALAPQMRSWRQVQTQLLWLTRAQRMLSLPWRTACPRRCRIPSPS